MKRSSSGGSACDDHGRHTQRVTTRPRRPSSRRTQPAGLTPIPGPAKNRCTKTPGPGRAKPGRTPTAETDTALEARPTSNKNPTAPTARLISALAANVNVRVRTCTVAGRRDVTWATPLARAHDAAKDAASK